MSVHPEEDSMNAQSKTESVNVRSGADLLRERLPGLIKGGRFGLLTNPTGINRFFESTVDQCAGSAAGELSALFACEHGIRGERQAGVLFADERDPQLDIPVYSLYGERRKPAADMLEGLDAVIFDIQDLGIRFYTYLSTLVYLMEACIENGTRLIVLDRPNPLGGIVCEGGRLQPGFDSMVGAAPVPIRTGLTIGEFAMYMNGRLGGACDLHVIPLKGWRRDMMYTDTGLPWIMPSPNMPSMDTVRVYPGNCLFEGTNLSEGRGTTKPFELIGAPWLDGSKVCRDLNSAVLPGVYFHPFYFTPTFSKHEGKLCGGVQCHVTDAEVYRPVETALYMLHRIQNLYSGEFRWLPQAPRSARPFIDSLTGSDLVRKTLHEEKGWRAIVRRWSAEAAEWEQERQPFLLYDADRGHTR